MDKPADFRPSARKILVSTGADAKPAQEAPAEEPPAKAPVGKAVVAATVSQQARATAAPEPTAEPVPTPEPEEGDKTSFPPSSVDEEPAVDLDALHRQYHIPVGKVARKFSPRRHWWWLSLLILAVGALVVILFIEPQL